MFRLLILGMAMSLFLTDRLGRKLLLAISGIGCGICLCVLAWSFEELLAESRNLSPIMKFVPLIAMLIFYLIFSVGYGPVPLILIGELFPTNTKAFASSVGISVLWMFDFAVAKLYFLVENHIGVGYNFYLLAGLTFLGVIFILLFVPETKNKTLAEIQTLVEKRILFLSCGFSTKNNKVAPCDA